MNNHGIPRLNNQKDFPNHVQPFLCITSKPSLAKENILERITLSRQSLDLLNTLSILDLTLQRGDIKVILPMRVMRIFHTEQIASLGDVVAASEQSVDFLQTDLFGLGDHEPDEDGEQEVDAREHVEGVEAALVEEGGEELLDDRVGDVLGLRGHADGLGAHVHAEDLGRPDPGRCAP